MKCIEYPILYARLAVVQLLLSVRPYLPGPSKKLPRRYWLEVFSASAAARELPREGWYLFR
jgi:hypothetical protein